MWANPAPPATRSRWLPKRGFRTREPSSCLNHYLTKNDGVVAYPSGVKYGESAQNRFSEYDCELIPDQLQSIVREDVLGLLFQ